MTIEEAVAMIGERLPVTATCTTVTLHRADGRIAAETLYALIDLPPFASLIHPPTATDRTLARQERSLQQRHTLEHSAMQCRVVDLHSPLPHHLLDLAVAQRIRHLPANISQDDVTLEVAAFELDRHRLPNLNQRLELVTGQGHAKLATEPVRELCMETNSKLL